MELNTRKEMKKITIVLVLFFLNIGNSFCQESGKFLVFTFNCVYEIGEYKHGTGDNLWIIPYDSCLINFSDRKLTYRAQNETYMCRSAENVVKCLCFNKLCAVG